MTIDAAKNIIAYEAAEIKKSIEGFPNADRVMEPEEYKEHCTKFVAALEMALLAMESWDTNLDIEYDYKGQAKQLKDMILYFKTDERPVKRDGVWLCPACGKRISEWHSHCHCCGKKVGWDTVLKRKPRDWYKNGKKR